MLHSEYFLGDVYTKFVQCIKWDREENESWYKRNIMPGRFFFLTYSIHYFWHNFLHFQSSTKKSKARLFFISLTDEITIYFAFFILLLLFALSSVISSEYGRILAIFACSTYFLEQHWASWINLACSDACNRRNKSDFHVDVLFICHKPVIEKREGCPTTFLLWSNKTHIWIRMYWIALCKEQYL